MKGLLKKYFFLPLFFLLSGGHHVAAGQVGDDVFIDSAVRVYHPVSHDIPEIEKVSSDHGSAAFSHTSGGTFNTTYLEIFEENVDTSLKFSSATAVLGCVRQYFRIPDFLLPARKLFSAGYLLPVKLLYIFFSVFRL